MVGRFDPEDHGECYKSSGFFEFFGLDYGRPKIPVLDEDCGLGMSDALYKIVKQYPGKRNDLVKTEQYICEFENEHYLENYKKFLSVGRSKFEEYYNPEVFYSKRKTSREDFNKENDLPVKYINRLEDIAKSLGKDINLEDYPKDYAELKIYSYNKIAEFTQKYMKPCKDLGLDLTKDEDVFKAKNIYQKYFDLVCLMEKFLIDCL